MSAVIISVENLCKKYRITHRAERRAYTTLRETISEKAKHFFKKLKHEDGKLSAGLSTHSTSEEFWALNDVSFEIKQGEVMGIIGKNGAGKSTLLKILSRITEPTKGRVHIRGRVASLLEVGTGFHPELTGRENIYLNGAILGMSKAEINRKFDEIVTFAEVEKFLDTPVKRYSSGMYVRLAFAVAAHLEPEILLVDEVLAVGDAQFQKKCLGKMQDVSRGGRTVLFVSHNMPAIQQLCSRSIWIQLGKIAGIGEPAIMAREYLKHDNALCATWTRSEAMDKSADVEITEVAIFNSAGESSANIRADESFEVRIRLRSRRDYENLEIAIRFTNQDGVPVLSTCNIDQFGSFRSIRTGQHEFSVQMPANLLAPNQYTLKIAALVPTISVLDLVDDKLSLVINEIGSLGVLFNDMRLGVVQPVIAWNHATTRKSVC